MFVVNLAFSDFCMMITQFPMFVHNSFNGGQWLFGPSACELYACTGMALLLLAKIQLTKMLFTFSINFFKKKCAGSIFGATSICTMAVIAYDRYNVIVKGMSGTRMTSSKSRYKN